MTFYLKKNNVSEILKTIGSNVAVADATESSYIRLTLTYHDTQYELNLHLPTKEFPFFDIGLKELQEASSGMDPENQTHFYWHVTSLLQRINQHCEAVLEQ